MVLQRTKLLLKKNRCLLADRSRPAQRNRVNLDWWTTRDIDANLGDDISPVIVDWMLQKRGLSQGTPVKGTKFLTAVGSVLDIGLNDSTVWGSGLLKESFRAPIWPKYKRLDIRAVRGPRTAQMLRDRGYECPEVFGDPAILMPLIYQPERVEEPGGPLLVSHIFDQAIFPGDALSMSTSDYESFVERISAASLVVTSSLHGIILAESYGTPAVLVRSDRDDFSLHKYRDWYESTGRTSFPVANDVSEALTLEPVGLPDLTAMQQELMDVFPYDLWENDSRAS